MQIVLGILLVQLLQTAARSLQYCICQGLLLAAVHWLYDVDGYLVPELSGAQVKSSDAEKVFQPILEPCTQLVC